MPDVIVIGAGFAGAAAARKLAEAGRQVLILEQRNHAAGNCYDEKDAHGVLIHTYGPHIFHTSDKEVYEFLSRFTTFTSYHHEVKGNIHGKLVPLLFNLNSLVIVFGPEKGRALGEKLTAAFGYGSRVPIMKLRESGDPEIREVADYVYENVFLHYTMKQWGLSPEQIDPQVTGRVPVVISREDGYFTDPYQGMPADGYTALFRQMLSHPLISLVTGCRAQERLKLSDGKFFLDGAEFGGDVIYTGPVDELFDNCFGALPYRSLRFSFEYYEMESYQDAPVVNYTVDQAFTRISEFKKLTGQKVHGTTIAKEYPCAFEPGTDLIPYYAILNPANQALYERYRALAGQYRGLHLLGRLAEYKYYNMDAITGAALRLASEMGRT